MAPAFTTLVRGNVPLSIWLMILLAGLSVGISPGPWKRRVRACQGIMFLPIEKDKNMSAWPMDSGLSDKPLWSALDKRTRGNSPNRRYVPVVLSVIAEEDIDQLTRGAPMSQINKDAIARIIREAFAQGGILSSRDIGLITLRDPTKVSAIRKEHETQYGCTLPHTGALHDMGSCISHKTTMVRKVIVEKKDPAYVARECNHSQRAVDHHILKITIGLRPCINKITILTISIL